MTIGEWVREGKLLTVHTPDLLSRSNEEPGSGLNRMGGRAGYRQRESFMGSDKLASRSMGRSVGRPVLDGCERVSTTSCRRRKGGPTSFVSENRDTLKQMGGFTTTGFRAPVLYTLENKDENKVSNPTPGTFHLPTAIVTV
jgi:hypothetical protein